MTDLDDLKSDNEVIDLEEQASIEAAENARQLWKEFFEEVCAADVKLFVLTQGICRKEKAVSQALLVH